MTLSTLQLNRLRNREFISPIEQAFDKIDALSNSTHTLRLAFSISDPLDKFSNLYVLEGVVELEIEGLAGNCKVSKRGFYNLLDRPEITGMVIL